jgi:hypothetical protein
MSEVMNGTGSLHIPPYLPGNDDNLFDWNDEAARLHAYEEAGAWECMANMARRKEKALDWMA